MLLGYVSNEQYQALHDVAVEVRDATGAVVADVRSTASGAVYAPIEPSDYDIVLAKDGYGSKRSRVTSGVEPVMFRLLSETMCGYMWPKWVRSGDQAELRVHSPEAYRVELWRYGLTKEFVSLLGWFDEHGSQAMRQVLPDLDITQYGAAFNSVGFTSAGHIKQVTAPERSGLYYLHVTTESGVFYSIPWVVAPKQPGERVAVLAATNNWNAYNHFGGRSNYINEANLPPTPTVTSRQDLPRYVYGNVVTQTSPNDSIVPLSFDRPDFECGVTRDEQLTDPLVGRLSGTLSAGFWRLVGWMEREGIGHDVYSDYQLHDGTLDLDAYDVLVMECHPEYWSRQMYLLVKEWVEQRGGRLAYLGGNGIDCEIVFDEHGTAARYLHHQPDESNPAERHLESRFHSTFESQAKLLGVVFTHEGEGTGAPYRVIDETSWIYEGTGLKNGDLFGLTSMSERIPGGASGHETDKRTPNTPEDFVLLAKGTNPDDGGAEIVYRNLTAPGGEVFSTGSMTYIPALLVDDALSTITANVLRKFTAS
jgi:N,N-dimethylformamidase